jgi:hypothetical protein
MSNEQICQKCGRANPVWSAENDLFNEVNGSSGGIMCPVCFGEMAALKNIDVYFRATRTAPLPTVSVEQAAEAYAHKKWEDGFFMSKQSIVEHFLAGASNPITEELIKELEGKNPWNIHSEYWNNDKNEAWEKCISTLRELIKSKQ